MLPGEKKKHTDAAGKLQLFKCKFGPSADWPDGTRITTLPWRPLDGTAIMAEVHITGQKLLARESAGRIAHFVERWKAPLDMVVGDDE